MQLPALHIRQPDIGNALLTAQSVKSARVRNRLLEAKLAREGKIADLTGEAMDDMAQPRNALAARAADPGMGADADAMGGQPGRRADAMPESLRALAALDPSRARQVVDLAGTLDGNRREQVDRMAATGARLAIGVLDAPPAQRPAAYQQALQIAGQQGMAVDTMPPEHGPEAERRLQTLVLEAMSIKDIMAMRKPSEGFRRTGDGLEPIPGGPKDPKYIGKVSAARATEGQDPARVKEANWLVENKIFPNLKQAYEATRTRVQMDPASIRTKGLAWVSNQKDRVGRHVYDTPEKQAAALAAYERWVGGDSEGALAALKALAPPKRAEDEVGMMEGLWRSITGGKTDAAKPAAKPAETPKPERKPAGETRKAPDGKDYPAVATAEDYARVKAGETYFHVGKGQFLTKGAK